MGTAIVVGVIAIGITGALLTLALALHSETRRAGDEKSGRAELAVRLEVAIANGQKESARADFEKGRADALDVAIAKFAARAVGPVNGSFAELLQEVSAARARASGRQGADVVRDAGAPGAAAGADRDDPDRLLRPGE